MEFAKNLGSARRNHGGPGVALGSDGAVLEWGGLLARLSAAHALRRELTRSATPAAPLRGSFSDWPVPGCDGLRRKRLINLKDSTDRKGPWAIEADNAGQFQSGGREQ